MLTRQATEYSKYNFGHDEYDNSAQKLREWKWASIPRTTFGMPAAFGPSSSMLSSCSLPAASRPQDFTIASVRFKTSRTLIQNLLPPGASSFAFETPGTVATCSFVQTSFGNVQWLKGGNYNTLGLYVHNISIKDSAGVKHLGYYAPVLFEDHHFTVIQDRESYGLPTIYSPISIEQTSQSYRINVGSKETPWARIELQDLIAVDHNDISKPHTSIIGYGEKNRLISWRSVCNFALKESNAAEDYAVLVSMNDEESPLQTQERWETSKASIEIDSFKEEPVLDVISSRLSEIPIYEIVGASLLKGTGSAALNTAQRIQ